MNGDGTDMKGRRLEPGRADGGRLTTTAEASRARTMRALFPAGAVWLPHTGELSTGGLAACAIGSEAVSAPQAPAPPPQVEALAFSETFTGGLPPCK